MNYNPKVFLLTAILFPFTSYGSVLDSLAGKYFSVGLGSSRLNPQVHINYIDQSPWPSDKNHITGSNNAVQWLINLGVYGKGTIVPFYKVGLELDFISQGKVHGNVEQFSLAEFTNYDFIHKFDSRRALVKAQVGLFQVKMVRPFISFAAGLAANRAYGYSEWARSSCLWSRNAPQFLSKTHRGFTYSAGAGVDFAINKNSTVALSYQFDALGKVRTSNGLGTYMTSYLHNKINANTLTATFTYLA